MVPFQQGIKTALCIATQICGFVLKWCFNKRNAFSNMTVHFSLYKVTFQISTPSFIQQSSFTNNQYHNHHQDQGNDDDLNPDQDQLLVLAGPSCSDQRCPQRLIPALPKSPISSISRPSAIIIVTTIVIVIVIITTTNEAQAVILAAEAQLFNPTSGGVLFQVYFLE